MKQKVFKKISHKSVKIFKIANRKGYGALCMNNLTEGLTSAQAYRRMVKAVKRKGYELPLINNAQAKGCLIAKI